MLIDTHAHLNFSNFDKDRGEIIKNCLKNNIFLINVGVNFSSSQGAIEIAKNYKKGVYASVGVHPADAGKGFDEQKFNKLTEDSKVVAVGELGLDYFRAKNKEEQKRVFIKQLNFAKSKNLSVIIHTRNAARDTKKILSNFNLKGVIHCFSGSVKDAAEYIEMGYFLGINGIIYKTNMEEALKKIPLEKIILETDCPFLIPPQAKEKSGVKRNEPKFVKFIAETLSNLKNIPLDAIEQKTTQNALGLFKI